MKINFRIPRNAFSYRIHYFEVAILIFLLRNQGAAECLCIERKSQAAAADNSDTE